ncbi:MAG: hypothetical protein AVDCRST_MAG88-2343 [uncultured Thermomicrobiales bacterium]|uniref:Gfo/Idh/MocA-like oxidoreductase C-terminal domain-containing protein n=1 Tax=uncultured Thermomicrobiales bacterium TaxID=1645740 RepID=A0A6J4V7X3_9BACT|nr:MAG: hypothetical protein AVDCRST_MAG88-2343 [uncultured Thermomicrobiales bacterium]
MSGLLTLAGGLPISVVQSCETPAARHLGGYTIHGTRGSLHATAAGYTLFAGDGRAQPPPQPYPADDLSDYAREIEAFADHVAGVAEGPTTGRSERRSLAVIEAGYESARTGRPVDLRERFGSL